MTLLDVVDICARLNVDAFEATSYYFPNTSDEFIYKLKRHAFLAGVAVSCSPTRDNFCVAKGPGLDKEIEGVKAWIDVAAKLGAPAVRIFAGGAVKGVTREESFENAVSAMRSAADYAGQHGIFLALEDHHYMTETADDVLKLVNAANHDWLGINMDTGNFKTNPYAELEQIAPRGRLPDEALHHEPADQEDGGARLQAAGPDHPGCGLPRVRISRVRGQGPEEADPHLRRQDQGSHRILRLDL